MKIRHHTNHDHLLKVLHARRMIGFGEGFLVKQRPLRIRLSSRAQCGGEAELYRKLATRARNERMAGEAA